MAGRIVVVGSLNTDFVLQAERIPVPGETLLATADLVTNPGGKGANQAFAVGRLGGAVAMVGRVGSDPRGRELKDSLRSVGVDIAEVSEDVEAPTGLGSIIVDSAGQNSIVVAAGANARLTPQDLEAASPLFEKGGTLLVQLEVPVETVEDALRRAKSAGMTTILDPAPAPLYPLPESFAGLVDILTPNESEARVLLGEPPGEIAADEVVEVARRLQRLGPRNIVLTLGERGALLLAEDGDGSSIPTPRVEVRDTTAAGDTLNAALAVALAEGRPLVDAIAFACTAAALAVTRVGAQSSVPERSEVDTLLSEMMEDIIA